MRRAGAPLEEGMPVQAMPAAGYRRNADFTRRI